MAYLLEESKKKKKVLFFATFPTWAFTTRTRKLQCRCITTQSHTLCVKRLKA